MIAKYRYVICVLLAVVTSFLIITPEHFPYTGLALTFSLLSTLVYFVKKSKSLMATTTYAFIIVLSASLVLRVNPLLTFYNLIALCYLLTFLVLVPKVNGVMEILLSPLALFQKVLTLKYHFDFGGSISGFLFKKKQGNGEKSKAIFFSILLTCFLLLIVLPILSVANPYFARMMDGVFDFFQIGQIIEYLMNLSILLYTSRIVLAVVLIYLLPRLLHFVESDLQLDIVSISTKFLNLLIPKITISVVMAIFFVAQIQLYTATSESLKALGYSNSQLTREVFGQLGFVSMIIFALLYNDTKRSRMRNIFTYILIVEGIFLTFMAFKSVYDYVFAYGFTFKRLYGFSVVFWLLGLYAGYLFFYLKGLDLGKMVRVAILWTALVLVGINLANFDYLIAHRFSPIRSSEGDDHHYIRYAVSADGGWYRDFIDMYFLRANGKLPEDPSLIYAPIERARELRNKFKKVDWRSFNYSEYREYQSIEGLDLENMLILVDQYYRIRERLIQETDMRNGGVFVEQQDGPIFVEVKPRMLELR